MIWWTSWAFLISVVTHKLFKLYEIIDLSFVEKTKYGISLYMNDVKLLSNPDFE